jgi:hypothetical protein
MKACLNIFQMSTNVMGFQWSRKITNIFLLSDFGDKSRPPSLKGQGNQMLMCWINYFRIPFNLS